MGWFDEQIRQRVHSDDEMLADAFAGMVNIVSTEKIMSGMADNTRLAATAIGDILRYYHVKALELPDSIEDIDEILEYLLRPSGLMRRPVKLSRGWYKDAVGAMLGTLKDGSVVALIPGMLGGYYIRDYTTGETVRVTAKNEIKIDDEAICFYQPLPLRQLKAADLLKYVLLQIRASDYTLIAGSAAAVTLLGLAVPAVTRFLYGDVLKMKNLQLLLGAVLTLLCVNLASAILGIIRSIIDENVSTKLSLSVESAMMMRVLSLPVGFFKEFSAGELANRISNVNSLCGVVFNAIVSIGLTSVFSLIYIGQIFAYAPALVDPAMTVTFITVVISIVTAMWQMSINESRLRETGKEDGMVYSLIAGVAKIKNAGAEKRAFSKWSEQYVKAAGYMYRPPMFLRLSATITTAVTLTGTIVMYFVALRSNVSMADYMAFNSSYGMVSAAFTSLSSIAVVISKIRPTINLIQPILDAEPELTGTRPVVTGLRGSIELNHVSFRYKDNMPNVLNDLSLKISAGQYIAIVGKTGCGKSTLMRILLGFEKPQKGAVYYDGRDIANLDLKSLRKHIGVVMQDSKLFQGDIYSNIIISAPMLTLDAAWEAAEMAGMAEDIRKMPMGMNTILSEGQGGISGGQRQRLMIARAIAPKPSILMFDEATSALDNITQKTVSDSLDKLKCTRIVIAHRLSTIRHCDRIIVLENGGIIEDGTYDELIAKGGYFSELVKRQQVE